MIKEIRQVGDTLQAFPDNLLPYKYSENIQIPIIWDDTFAGYSMKWDAYSSNKKHKRIPVSYDADNNCISLSKECFYGNKLYLACAFIQGDSIKNSSMLQLEVPVSVNHGLNNDSSIPNLFDEMKELFQQIFDNEYKTPLEHLIETTKNGLHNILGQAKDLISDIYSRLANDEFRGQQGIQGEKGEKGDKGDQGESGVTVPANGMFTFSGNSTTGDLWCYYPDDNTPPLFEVDENGNIYCVLSE